MYGLLDISTSGMIAQRIRVEVATANIANADSILDPHNNDNIPFRRRMAVLAPGDPRSGNPLGVHVQNIALSNGAYKSKYDPGNPHADERGMIYTPDIDITTETVNAMEANRAYEANIMAAEATKAMVTASMRLLA